LNADREEDAIVLERITLRITVLRGIIQSKRVKKVYQLPAQLKPVLIKRAGRCDRTVIIPIVPHIKKKEQVDQSNWGARTMEYVTPHRANNAIVSPVDCCDSRAPDQCRQY